MCLRNHDRLLFFLSVIQIGTRNTFRKIFSSLFMLLNNTWLFLQDKAIIFHCVKEIGDGVRQSRGSELLRFEDNFSWLLIMDIKKNLTDYWELAKVLTDYWEPGTPIKALKVPSLIIRQRIRAWCYSERFAELEIPPSFRTQSELL